MAVDQIILDGVDAAGAAYADISTGTSSLSGYSIVGTPYNDENSGGPALGLQMVIYTSADHSQVIVSFVGTNEGKDAIGDLGLAWDQYSASKAEIQSEIAAALSDNPGAAVTFAGHSAGGIVAQYAAYDYQTEVNTSDDTTVNLVTNNAPGATEMIIAQKGDDYDPSVGSSLTDVANTFERDDIVHMMGSEYLGGNALEIDPAGVYDPISAHLVSNSINDLNNIACDYSGYNLVSVVLQTFGIAPTATAATAQELADFADVIAGFNNTEAFAYAFGAFLNLAGTLADEGQTAGVKQLLDTLIDREFKYLLAQPDGGTFLQDVGSAGLAIGAMKLEDIAGLSPTALMAAGTAIKDAAIGGEFTSSTPEGLLVSMQGYLISGLQSLLGNGNPYALGEPVDDPAVWGGLGHFGNGATQHSPLVIDLSSGHTGITLTEFNASTTTTFYDLDRTGFAEQTAWITGDTGFLVQQNTDGSINLFGTSTVDGFAELAKLDSNHDLKIDSHDADWSTLNVWLDANGNAVVDSGELHSLSSLGIASIDLAGVTPSTDTVSGNPISHTSTVTFSDGSTTDVADAWLVHSTVDTYYNGDYTLDTDTLFLPDLRGYGNVAQLSIAISQDSTLKGLVADFASGFSLSSFADPSTLDNDISNILYRWAGVDGVDPSSRGTRGVDAQDLEFLEHLFGQNFSQFGNPNPDANASALVETAWQEVRDGFKAELIVQTGAASELFDAPVAYNTWTGTFDGAFHLAETGVENLATYAPTTTEAAAEAFWVSVADFIDNTEGIANLDTDEQGWLDTAVSSTTTISWSDVVDLYNHSGATGDYIDSESDYDTVYGTSGDDTINVTGSHTTVYETSGNNTIQFGVGGVYGNYDTVHLGSGNNTLHMSGTNNTVYCDTGSNAIYASGGHDTFYMGTGGNTISANGNDSFIYAGGDTVINEHNSGTNLIVLPSGITSSDVTFWRIGSDNPSYFDDLLIKFSDGGTIQVENQFNAGSSAQQVQTLEFSDTSTIDLTALTAMTWLLTGNETVTVSSGSGDSLFELTGGANTLHVTDGDNRVELLSGGNNITGGSGDDTYVAGVGYNVIHDTAGTNTLEIPTGFTGDDVTISRILGSSDAIVTIAGLGEIQLNDEFYASGNGIQNFHFMDGDSTVAVSSLTVDIIGTSGNDTMVGATVNAGANWFDGRGGNDSITGGVGNNTFVFHAGFGTDTISLPYHTGNTNVISFEGVDPANIRMWTTSDGSLHLQDTTDTSHSITVYAGITGSGTDETAIGSYLEQVKFDDASNTTWDLTGGLTLTGTSSGETIYGSAYNDTIYSMGGDDTLYGNHGNDTYVIPSNFGNVAIHEGLSSGTDTVHIAGVDPANVIASVDSSGNLLIQKVGDTSHTITIYGGLSGGNSTVGSYVEQIAFDNGTTWDLTSGVISTATNTTSTTINGTSGNDIITIGTGGGTINGSDGNDILYGNTGNDTLNGGNGNDTMVSSAGTDTMAGGAGNDTYVFTSGFGNTTVNESASNGTDSIHFSGISPTDIRMYTDTSGYLHLVDTVSGNGITVLAGVTGSNNYESTVGARVESVTFDDSNNTVWDLTGGLTLTGTSSAETLYGTAYNDTLYGLGGNDSIYGNAGNDTITGGTGNDTMYGGPGNDTYIFASGWGSDTVNESAGNGTDVIHFTGINPSDIRMYTDTSGYLHLVDTATGDSISVVAGITGSNNYESTVGTHVESVTFDDSNNTVWDLTGGLTLTGTSSAESLYGTAYNDTLYGLGGNDSIYGNAGNDTITGGTGNDTMYGGPGNDTYIFASGWGADTVNESPSAGTDVIHFTGINPSDIRMYTDTSGYLHLVDTATGDSISVVAGITGSNNYESTVGARVESVTFDDANNTVWDLTGGLTLTGTTSNESLYGTAYNDTINGMGGADNLYGNAGNDTIYGGSGNDIIHGGPGNDILQGNGGTDNLYGDAGADTFMFKAASAFSASVNVEDFSTSAGDKIDISDVISGYDPATMAITDWVQITTSGSNSILKVDIDGTGSGHTWQQIATIVGVTGLTDEAALVASGNLVVPS